MCDTIDAKVYHALKDVGFTRETAKMHFKLEELREKTLYGLAHTNDYTSCAETGSVPDWLQGNENDTNCPDYLVEVRGAWLIKIRQKLK